MPILSWIFRINLLESGDLLMTLLDILKPTNTAFWEPQIIRLRRLYYSSKEWVDLLEHTFSGAHQHALVWIRTVNVTLLRRLPKPLGFKSNFHAKCNSGMICTKDYDMHPTYCDNEWIYWSQSSGLCVCLVGLDPEKGLVVLHIHW